MRVRTLADMENFAQLPLGQVRVRTHILNTLKFYVFTSFSEKYKTERFALLQYRAKWTILKSHFNYFHAGRFLSVFPHFILFYISG